jgi:hypothetical protein
MRDATKHIENRRLKMGCGASHFPRCVPVASAVFVFLMAGNMVSCVDRGKGTTLAREPAEELSGGFVGTGRIVSTNAVTAMPAESLFLLLRLNAAYQRRIASAPVSDISNIRDQCEAIRTENRTIVRELFRRRASIKEVAAHHRDDTQNVYLSLSGPIPKVGDICNALLRAVAVDTGDEETARFFASMGM